MNNSLNIKNILYISEKEEKNYDIAFNILSSSYSANEWQIY